MDDKKAGVAVPARTVPFPSSISAEARSALERQVLDDGAVVNAGYVMPDPGDVEGWTEIKAAADARYSEAVKRFAGHARSSIKTIEVGTATLHVATPEVCPRQDCAIIDFHGGALVFGGGDACRVGAQMQADQHGVRCYGVDYRTPPEHPYPAAVDDCMAAYRYVLEHHAPANVLLIGRSAGGNLAVATLIKAREENWPLPAGLVLLSPQVDLTESGDSFEVNQLVDVILPGPLMANNLLYADGADLTHPHLSPLFGDLHDFPPTFVQSGTRDLFLSNTVRMHRALRHARVAAELHVFEAMPHGGFGGATPEDRELREEITRFVGSRWSALKLAPDDG